MAYYNFRMKTIDFFNSQHFQQLNVFTQLLITEIDLLKLSFYLLKTFYFIINVNCSDQAPKKGTGN